MKYDPESPPTAGAHNHSSEGKYILRLYDMFDGWLSPSKPMTWPEAVATWSEHTKGGTKNICYGDGDYWAIFPAGFRMLITPEFLGR